MPSGHDVSVTTTLNPVGMEHAKVMYLMSKAELGGGAHCTECLVHGEEMGQSFLPSFQYKTGVIQSGLFGLLVSIS